MTAVFLDTVGLLAVWDVADQWHAVADPAFRTLLRGRLPMLTATLILAECGNAAARRPYRDQVCRLREIIERGGGLIAPTDHDWDDAWFAYERGHAGTAGLVDHVSFAVMRRLGVTDAFTNDRQFAAAGVHPLF